MKSNVLNQSTGKGLTTGLLLLMSCLLPHYALADSSNVDSFNHTSSHHSDCQHHSDYQHHDSHHQG